MVARGVVGGGWVGRGRDISGWAGDAGDPKAQRPHPGLKHWWGWWNWVAGFYLQGDA